MLRSMGSDIIVIRANESDKLTDQGHTAWLKYIHKRSPTRPAGQLAVTHDGCGLQLYIVSSI